MSARGARSGRTAAVVAVLGAALLGVTAVPAAGQATWRLEQPPPPEGAPFKVPLGAPGDLQFFAPNRGLLSVEGNSTIPRGLYVYNGEGWRQLSTVCGGPGDTTRIAFSGPTEFWTITEPSRPRAGTGRALCRFKDGRVVASYSTPDQSVDPYRTMNAASCTAPDNCWFGGVGSQDPSGERAGAFHLRWDGTALRTIYNPQGRGVSDLENHNGTIFESVVVGRAPEGQEPAELERAEAPAPRLLHRLVGETFADEPFAPAVREGVPADGTELLGLDSSGSHLWAVGGGAASGPSAAGGMVARPPLAALYDGSSFREIDTDSDELAADDRFVDVGAIPGTDQAWTAVQRFAERRSVNAKARVARIAPDGTQEVVTLPGSGSGRGSAARIACVAANDCWMVTFAGWLFHYTDGSRPPRDTEPAFERLITFRPNEAAEQFVPDAPPADDSQLFAPPPLEIVPQAAPTEGEAVAGEPLAPLIRNVGRPRRKGLTIVLRFRLVRRARIALIGRRGKRTVCRTKTRTFKPGRRTLKLRCKRNRWPTRLRFAIRELDVQPGAAEQGDGAGAGDTVSTGGGSRPAPTDAPSTPGSTTTTGDTAPAGGPAQSDTVTTGGGRR